MRHTLRVRVFKVETNPMVVFVLPSRAQVPDPPLTVHSCYSENRTGRAVRQAALPRIMASG